MGFVSDVEGEQIKRASVEDKKEIDAHSNGGQEDDQDEGAPLNPQSEIPQSSLADIKAPQPPISDEPTHIVQPERPTDNSKPGLEAANKAP